MEHEWDFYYTYQGKSHKIKVTRDNEMQVADIILDTPKESRTRVVEFGDSVKERKVMNKFFNL